MDMSKFDRQIISARILLESAQIQAKRTGFDKAFAVLHAHDGLDWVLQLCYQYLVMKGDERPKSNKRKTYSDMIAILRNHEQFRPFVDAAKCNQLNSMRNNLKHNFVISDARQIEEIVVWAKVQADELVKIIAERPLEEFSLLKMVESAKVRGLIEEADEAMQTGDFGLCSERLATAYNELDRTKRRTVQTAMGFTIPPLDSPYFTGSKDLELDEKFAEAWDGVVCLVKFQNLMSSADLLNVDRSDFLRFLRVVPEGYTSIDGKERVTLLNADDEKKLTREDLEFCRNLVLMTAINNGL